MLLEGPALRHSINSLSGRAKAFAGHCWAELPFAMGFGLTASVAASAPRQALVHIRACLLYLIAPCLGMAPSPCDGGLYQLGADEPAELIAGISSY